jgi:putative inorganic carbon (HCO3(-)) transporter
LSTLRAQRVSYPWLAIALLTGTLAAVLPPQISLLLFGMAVLGVLSLIDVRVALLATLVIAPFKQLIETELHLSLDPGQLALLVTVGIWLARSIADKRRLGIPWTPVYVPLAIFIFAASLSLWTALEPGTTLTELAKWIEVLIVIALVVSLGQTGGPTWIAAAVIISAAVQAIIGVYQFFGGSGAPPLWILDYRYFRAFGTFGQPNPFGAFMGLTLPLALGMSYGAAQTAQRAYLDYRRFSDKARRQQAISSGVYAVLALIGAGIIGVGLLASWSRGAWLGAVAALLVMVLFAPKRRWLGVVMVTLLTLGLWLSLITGLAPESLVARFTDFTQDLTGYEDVRGQVINDANYAVLERLAHWQAALGMAADAPWLGVGFGNYEAAYPRYALMNWPIALGHAHNYYLNLLAETGLIGLLGYLIAWGGVFGMTLRLLRCRAGIARGMALGLLGVWVHLSVHSLFDKLYVNNLFLHLGAMLGLIGILLIAGNEPVQTPTET